MADDPNPPEPPPAPGGPASVAPAAPTAAKVVLTGQKTERELSLETELDSERNSHAKTAKEKKDRETRIAELEDELHRLRHPAKPKEEKSAMEEFFEG